MSNKLSFTITGHNEEEHLKQLLPTLCQSGDEVIYVDLESSDNSYNYAKELGCKAYKQPNNPNWNINKSYAFEQATGDWIFYIDPDERLPEALLKEIRKLLHSKNDNVAYTLSRKNYFFGHWLKHGGQYPDVQLRLFKRGFGKFENKHVHEKLKINGKTGKLENDMIHHTYLNMSEYLNRFDFYTSFEADFLYQQKVSTSIFRHLQYLLLKPFTRFIRRYFFKFGFLDGIPGFFAAAYDSWNFATRYLKLWELHHGKNVLKLNHNKN